MPANRRLQRSVRVTVAVALLAVGAAVVVAALVSRGALWLGVAAVIAWGLGVAATRILSNELAESRRQHAQERAEQAQAYATLAARRASENSAFASAMRQRVSDHEANIERLKATLRLAERRAELAEQTAERNQVALAKAHKEIAGLRAEIARLEAVRSAEEGAEAGDAPAPVEVSVGAESDDAQASTGHTKAEESTHASVDAGEDLEVVLDDEMSTVVDLLAWEERPQVDADQRKHA